MKFLTFLQSLFQQSSNTATNTSGSVSKKDSKPVSQPIITLSALNAILIGLYKLDKTTSAEIDREQWLDKVIGIVHSHVDIYFLGFYILDPERREAIFETGTGQAGKVIRQKGHRLLAKYPKLNELVNENKFWIQGDEVLTYSLAQNPPWNLEIKFELSENMILPSNLLPDTRWELFLPLRKEYQALGVLWIHTSNEMGFSLEDITHFQFLADQISIRLQNLISDTDASNN